MILDDSSSNLYLRRTAQAHMNKSAEMDTIAIDVCVSWKASMKSIITASSSLWEYSILTQRRQEFRSIMRNRNSYSGYRMPV